MSNVQAFPGAMTVEERLTKRIATLRAMLDDSAEFLEHLVGVNPIEERNAQFQAEAIRKLLANDGQVLTDEPGHG
ncbi:hypothetical protein CcrColossus_gp217 [Caulobacter phage CcrColossus]|uniref:Uncharacterized protein n=1 Tax=Caulobacter phage CcrColossus TaxID=1211640 RepID=K4K6C4_9CAUD|nr:hypothetical protein CcrColossus_gp217 [Caulobacter phage CcrColossus]AFU88087.1 hypothetical protein CcrColossus_gp217 [Caulobacter phage CcrColossus]